MLRYIVLILTGLVLDQLSKLLVVHSLGGVRTLPIIKNVFHLTYIQNDGIAFSFLSGKQFFIIAVTLLCVIWLFFILLNAPKSRKWRLFDTGLAMIIAGAAGNLIDRITKGYVVDFFDFRLIGFPIFNVADVFVCAGAVVVLVAIFRDPALFDRGVSLQDLLLIGKRHYRVRKKSRKPYGQPLTTPVTPRKPKQNKPVDPPSAFSAREEQSLNQVKAQASRKNRRLEPDVHTDLKVLKPHQPKVYFSPTPPTGSKRADTRDLRELKKIKHLPSRNRQAQGGKNSATKTKVYKKNTKKTRPENRS